MTQGSKTILLIDDEAPTRDFVCRILRGAGYIVLEGEGYDEALALHERYSEEIDLLLVDAALPGRNGFELAQTLRQARPGLQVLFTSGHVGAQLCRFYGMSPTDVHFLNKPFPAAELTERIRCILTPLGRSQKSASS